MAGRLNEKTYWRVAFLFPLLAPLVWLGIIKLRSAAGVTGPPASFVEVVLLGSLFYGGALYVIFVLGLIALLWFRPAERYRKASWLAPPAFLLFFVVGFQVYWLIGSAGSWLDIPETLAGLSVMVLVVGYLYVAIAWLLRWLLRTAGLLDGTSRP
jgi:hypothetical protein